MSIQLSSLRVTADFDASGYTRGSTQKVDADARMTESDQRRVAALAAQDAATQKTAGALAKLSKSYVDGYSAGARFDQAIRNLQKGVEAGTVPLDRTGAILEGLHAKFGLMANAAEIAAKGNVDLANAVARTNAELTQSQLDLGKIAEATAVYTQNLDALRAKYDTVFAAQQRYKQELADIANAERQGAFAENPSVANTARLRAAETLGRATAPQASALSDSDAHMQAYRAHLVATAKEQAALRDAANKAAEALKAEFDPAYAAGVKYMDVLQRIVKAEKSGIVDPKLTDAARIKAYNDLQTSLKGVPPAAEAAATSTKALNQHVAQLGFQVNDVLTGLASGQPVFQIFAQQAGQVGQALAGPGGPGAVLQAFGQKILGWLNPLTLLATAFVAVGTAAIVASYKFQEAQRQIQISLVGIGRGSGATAGDINEIGEAIAQTSNVSIKEGRQIATALAATGGVGKAALKDIGDGAKGLSVLLGTDLTTANKRLAEIMGGDLVKGGTELRTIFGGINDVLLQQVARLQASGDRLGAQRLLMDAIKPQLQEAAKLTNSWGDAWDYALNKASNFFTRVGQGMSAANDASIESVKARIEVLKQRPAGRLPDEYGGVDPQVEIDYLQKQLAALEKVGQQAKKNAEDARANEAAQKANTRTEQGIPALRDFDDLQMQKRELKIALDNARSRGDLKNEDASRAQLEATERAILDYNSNIKILGEWGHALENGKENLDALALAGRKANAIAEAQREIDAARTPIQKAQAAQDMEIAKQVGMVITAQERRRLQGEAYNETYNRETEAIRRGIVDRDESTRGIDAETNALVKNGAGQATLARIRAQAKNERRTGQIEDDDVAEQARVTQLLREETAKLSQETARSTDTTKVDVSVRQKLEKEFQAGKISMQQYNEELQFRTEREKLLIQLSAASGDEAATLKQRIRELDDAHKSLISTQQQEFLNQRAEQYRNSAEAIALETKMVWASNEAREVALTKLRAEQELRAKGITGPKATADAEVAAANKKADQDAKNTTAAVAELKNVGVDAFTSLAKAIASGVKPLEAMLNVVKQVGDALVSGGIKNIIKGAESGNAELAAIGGAEAAVGLGIEYFSGQSEKKKQKRQKQLDDAKTQAEEAARKADEINQAISTYLQRITAAAFAGQADTLENRLAQFDAKAQSERLDAMAKGGVAINLLEQALGMERANIVTDWNKKIVDDQVKSAEDGQAKIDAILQRQQSAQDRIFAAGIDTNTLTGRMAALERQFSKERLDEAKAGGEAMTDLLAAQDAERLKLLKDNSDEWLRNQKAAFDDAKTFLTGALKSVKDFLAGLLIGQQSPLAPLDKLSAAQSQFSTQLALAQSGNRDALSGITGNASALLDAARGYHGSTSGYQATFAQVQSQLGALPSQVSPEQFIVNAIEQQTKDLGVYFDSIDKNGDGLITKTEANGTALQSIFNELDNNGDGLIEKSEFIKGNTSGTKSSVDAVKGGVDSVGTGVGGVATATGNVSTSVASGNSELALMRAALDTQVRALVISSAIVNNTGQLVNYQNSAQGIHGSGTLFVAYARGGYVDGPGTGTSDSIAARLSNGEYVMRAAAVRSYGRGFFDRLNSGTPIQLPSGGGGDSALLSELRALRAEVAQLRAVTAAGAEHIREGVDESGVSLAAMAKAAKLQSTRA